MKILIFGATGMLGHKLIQKLGGRFEVSATCRGAFRLQNLENIFSNAQIIENVDISDNSRVLEAIEKIEPDVVINAAGVIKQLPVSKDVTTALLVNSIFPQVLAGLAEKHNFRLITISTDCVFDGVTGNYTESDLQNALDLYGQSKRWGEVSAANCLTIRTSIIGHELSTHHSLVDWFLSNRGGSVRGFTGAIYSGFPTTVFADIIGGLIETQPALSGLYNVSSEPINKYELLRLINSEYEAGIEIEPDSEFRIDRSLNSKKFRAETGFMPLPWPEMVRLMKEDSAIYGQKRDR
jgi:dTDP-4-dehydrorhamnose reductase